MSIYYKEKVKHLFEKSIIISVPNYPLSSEYDSNFINEKINSFDINSKINLVYIGGLNRDFDRDVDLLIKIAENLLYQNENVNFFVAGPWADNYSKSRLLDCSERFNGRLKFLGEISRERAIEITQQSHIGFFLIKPNSIYWVKSSPNKVFEYLICGVIPVIRADVDQAEKIRRSALIFDRKTDEEEIICSISNLISNTNLLKDLLRSAKQLSNNFTWESVANNYIELYEDILNQ